MLLYWLQQTGLGQSPDGAHYAGRDRRRRKPAAAGDEDIGKTLPASARICQFLPSAAAKPDGQQCDWLKRPQLLVSCAMSAPFSPLTDARSGFRQTAARAACMTIVPGIQLHVLQAYDLVELYRRHGCVLQMAAPTMGQYRHGSISAAASPTLSCSRLPRHSSQRSGAKWETGPAPWWSAPTFVSPYDYWQYCATATRDVARFLSCSPCCARRDRAPRCARRADINEPRSAGDRSDRAPPRPRRREEAAATARKTFEEAPLRRPSASNCTAAHLTPLGPRFHQTVPSLNSAVTTLQSERYNGNRPSTVLTL